MEAKFDSNENQKDLDSESAEENTKNEDGQETEAPKMSKNAMKRLARLERVVQQRKETRKREREKRKEQGTSNLAVRVNAETGETTRIHRKHLKKNLMSSSQCKLRLVIDCSFEPLMSISDISHLAKQLAYSYGKNRRVQSPLQFYFTSIGGQTKEILDKSGFENWDLHRHNKHYLDVFSDVEKENIVYLTSDSSNVIEEFDENKVYIIGGLVDHNHHKSHCYDLAVKAGISHAQLPIGKFMHMKTRQVLTVNQVFEIISNYCECKDWLKSFVSVLPKRKGAITKDELGIEIKKLKTEEKPDSQDSEEQ